MSLQWRCVGSYFSEADVGSYDNEFINTSNAPFAIVKNGDYQSVHRELVNDEYEYYFHLGVMNNGCSELLYCLNDQKILITDLPCKIKFKARMYNYSNKGSTPFEFFPNVFIDYELVNDMQIPCFSNGNKNDNEPFSASMLNGEWFDFEALWVDGVEYVYINNVCIFNFVTDSILNETLKSIVNCNENFEIAFDIKELQFYKMYEKTDEVFVTSKNEDNTLSIISNISDDIAEYEPEYIRLEFTKLMNSQKICTQNIEIENCTFLEETEVYTGMYGIKTFTDNISGNNFDVHIFTDPCTFHNVTLLNNYQHLYYTGAYDSVNILFSVKQNNIDLRNRILTLRQNILNHECKKFTFNTYVNQWLYTSVERLFNDVEYLIPNLPFVEKQDVFVPDLNPKFVKHKIKIDIETGHWYFSMNTASLTIQNCMFVEDKNASEHEGDKIYYNTKTKENFKVHLTDLTNVNERIITNSYYYHGTNKHIILEFDSEGLELSDIQFSYGAGNSGALPIFLKFYFDDILKQQNTLGYAGGTVTLTIPIN